jgi:hypothetical protein
MAILASIFALGGVAIWGEATKSAELGYLSLVCLVPVFAWGTLAAILSWLGNLGEVTKELPPQPRAAGVRDATASRQQSPACRVRCPQLPDSR